MDNGTSTVEIDFRPRTDTDSEFLYTVYASTRIEERGQWGRFIFVNKVIYCKKGEEAIWQEKPED